jgi:hypothetical protein
VRKRSVSRAWTEGSASKNQIAEHDANLATVASRIDNAVVVVAGLEIVGNTLLWLLMLNTALPLLTDMTSYWKRNAIKGRRRLLLVGVSHSYIYHLAGFFERRCLGNRWALMTCLD